MACFWTTLYLWHAAVDCGPAPILLDSIPMINPLQKTTYGSQVGYKCISGNWFSRDRYTEVAKCTAEALWESGGETEPSKLPACIGKLNITVIVTELHVSPTSNLRHCFPVL